jgi:hypothetical protein
MKIWIVLFPHTFTIYLIHGFVFWSFGAWLCVTLASMEILPYWAICLVLFVCCYAVIGLAAFCITPFSEGTALALCRNCWRWANEEPVPHRKTLEPFRKDLFLTRNGGGDKDEETVVHGAVEVIDEKNFDEEKGGKGDGEGPFDDVHEIPQSSSGSSSVSGVEQSRQSADDAITPVIVTEISTEGLGIRFNEKK